MEFCSREQFENALDLEYYEFLIQQLDKERMKITRTGRLSEEQDRRLDEIDAELEYWCELADELLEEDLEQE